MFEQWVDIEGFDGKYKISNFGQVYSTYSNKMLKPINDGNGVWHVELYSDDELPYKRAANGTYRMKVHRLVGEHFIPNEEGHKYLLFYEKDKKKYHQNNLYWSACSRG